MADPPSAGVVEADLDHQLGTELDPLELLLVLPSARVAMAPLPGLIRGQLVAQGTLLSRPQPRRVADHVQPPALVIQPQDQRAHGPRLLTRTIARDHGVDRPHALDLHHPGPL